MDDLGQGGGGVGESGNDVRRRNPRALILVRSCCFVAFSLGASLIFSILFALLVFLIGSFSGSHSPVSVPAQCRVVSSSVDLRSSKVCELALSNYKAKHVLYPSGNSKVWCHDDYYWASIFKVEYKEYFSGRTLRGVAESPKEALPLYCRPSFTTAWVTNSKFKVNETYECKYALGTFKADIYPDHLFNCQAEDPSVVEMMRRFSILIADLCSKDMKCGKLIVCDYVDCDMLQNLMWRRCWIIKDMKYVKPMVRSLNFMSSFSWKRVRGWHHVLAAATGMVSGVLSCLCVVVAVKVFQLSRVVLSGKRRHLRHHLMMLAVQFRRVCLLIAYVSAVGWLTLQYSKFVGLKQLFFDSNSGTAITR
ncbi:hypothetical protein Taro_008065 [Colocasia esculenta]|uniref:Uncharacterized protein n=1 Tax=Colocasia esculenta TaxID=4460 RepID=A0A843TWL6_COLES|nr:hypothetical protein [Colocasia esculenta]